MKVASARIHRGDGFEVELIKMNLYTVKITAKPGSKRFELIKKELKAIGAVYNPNFLRNGNKVWMLQGEDTIKAFKPVLKKLGGAKPV